MSLKITAKSLGFLNDLPEEVVNDWHIEEYRAGGHSKVTIKGDSIKHYAEKIENNFYAYYPPNGYGSQFRESKDTQGQPVLVLERWLSCD